MKKNLSGIVLAILLIIVILILSYKLYFNTGSFKSTISNSNDKSNLQFNVEILVQNLDTPWAIDFLPSGEMVFTEREGKVNLWNGNDVRVIGEIEVSEISESGLAGIAVDPDFETNGFVYVYYTHNKGNRVSRFILENNILKSEFILLDEIPSAQFHDGGRIKFGPDGKLYVTTGDATNPSSAQDINSLSGKILRMNKDGSIPEDNPFDNYVYSYGHRNPQGIAWNNKGILFASEHGPTQNDEINKIEKGNNYGWPVECEKQAGIDDVKPVRCYTEFTLAPSGIAFYKSDLYVTGLRGAQVRRIVFNDEHSEILKEKVLFSGLGRIREVVEHDGYLYFATSNKDGRGIPKEGDDKIIRVKL